MRKSWYFREENMSTWFRILLLCFFASIGTAWAGNNASVTGDVSTEFGVYHPYPVMIVPAVEQYRVPDAFIDSLGFTGKEAELLKTNGFLVGPPSYVLSRSGDSDRYQRYATIPEMYKDYRERGIPIFVTTDAMLHSFHELYDYTLKETEKQHLAPNLKILCRALTARSEMILSSAANDSVKEAIRKNTAYFAVAAKLGDPSFLPPENTSTLVDAELALIDAHQGFEISPIFRFPENTVSRDFDYLEDYSQYVPRGHYADNDTLSTYFRSSMWLGRMAFRTEPHGGMEKAFIEKGIEETFRAILVVKTVLETTVEGSPALAVWHSVYDPVVFFVGRSDDLGIEEYNDTLANIYGADWLNLSPDALFDREKILAFIEEVKKLRDPLISSSWVMDNEDAAVATKAFRFLGQRFIPDSYMFYSLVYSRVGTRADPRLLPRGLDISAVLGSERALELLTSLYNQDRYANYLSQMTALRKEFSELSPETWVQNLYWNWLYSLLPLLEAKGAGYPPFMQSNAWTDKQLSTAIGSWTELRHDSILYAKQSYTDVEVGEEPFPATPWLRQGYVEPNPDLYGRLASLAALMREGLSARGLLSDASGERLVSFENLQLNLKTISGKELANIQLNSGEYETIANIGSSLEAIQPPAPIADTSWSPYNRNMALVADVHTDPNTRTVLEEAVGHASELFVIVKVAGRFKLARGAVYTGYEFTWPMSDRLTDSAWRDLLSGEQPPELPEWVESFRNRDALPIFKGWDIQEPVNGGLLAPVVTVNGNYPSAGDPVEITFRTSAALTGTPALFVRSVSGETSSAKMDTLLSGEGGYRYSLSTSGLDGEVLLVTIQASYLSGWMPDGTKYLSTLEYDLPLWIQTAPDTVDEERPASFALLPNIPNPFNGETEIRFTLPARRFVTVEVYDVLGRKIQTVYSGKITSGSHTIRVNMEDAASGVYFVRLSTSQEFRTRKMLLLR